VDVGLSGFGYFMRILRVPVVPCYFAVSFLSSLTDEEILAYALT